MITSWLYNSLDKEKKEELFHLVLFAGVLIAFVVGVAFGLGFGLAAGLGFGLAVGLGAALVAIIILLDSVEYK